MVLVQFIVDRLSNIDFSSVKKEMLWWTGCGITLFAIGKFFDGIVFGVLQGKWRIPLLDDAVMFLTEHLIWGILATFAIVTLFRVLKKPSHQSKLVPAIFAVISTGIASFVLKSFFHAPRPYEIMSLNVAPLVPAASFSFPSAHTAVAFALLIPFYRISKTIGVLWAMFAILIGFARVYENVHFPSDIAGGIFLGGLIGAFFSHPDIVKTLVLLWQEREFRRQSFHFIFGFSCVFLLWANFLDLYEIGVLLVCGLLLSYVAQFKTIPILADLLELFDRPRDKNFPGRGAFFFLLGVFLCVFIFQGANKNIAYASILILSVGDSLNHLFGTKLQRIRFPWNKRKNVLGVSIGILSGTFAAQFFVPVLPAFIASSIAILVETIPFRIGKFYIDDNIIVPLVAGSVISFLT